VCVRARLCRRSVSIYVSVLALLCARVPGSPKVPRRACSTPTGHRQSEFETETHGSGATSPPRYTEAKETGIEDGAENRAPQK